MKTLVFHLSGMHCPSCERLAEMELRAAPGVSSVKASLAKQTVELTGDFDNQPPAAVMGELNPLVRKHGYTLSLEARAHAAKWPEFNLAVPLALALMAAFLFAQKLGLGKLVSTAEMGYGVAFLVGIIASVSSCMAIVGGLVLSLSAYYAQKGDKVRPQVLFHAGRLGGFFVLGGIAGVVGSAFQPGAFGMLVLGLLVGGVMVAMGIRLLDIFPWGKRWPVTFPQSIGEGVHALHRRRAAFMPLVLGAATFFLPCGFTQTMQLYAMKTGSFRAGALTMLCFALGTLPVLALLSFSPLGTRGREKSGVFFKTAGLLVVFFGIYDMVNSLIGYGLLPPLFNS